MFWRIFFKDQTFRLVHWLDITLSLRKTSQESINLERKSYLDCSSDTHCTREEFGGVTYWLQTLRSWRRWTHRKSTRIYSKILNAKEVIIPKEKGEFIFSNRRWTNKIRWRRWGTDNIHLDTAATISRRRSKRFSKRIRRVSTSNTSRLTSGCPWSTKWFFGPFQETSYTAITLNHRVKLYSPREESFPIPLNYIDVSRTTHTNLEVKQEKRIDDYWNIDGSRDLSDYWTGFTQFVLLEEKTSRRIYVVQERDWQDGKLTSRPDHLWPEAMDVNWEEHAKLMEKQKCV